MKKLFLLLSAAIAMSSLTSCYHDHHHGGHRGDGWNSGGGHRGHDHDGGHDRGRGRGHHNH